MFLTPVWFQFPGCHNGDITQIDLPGDRKSGLKEARKILSEVEGVAFCRADPARRGPERPGPEDHQGL